MLTESASAVRGRDSRASLVVRLAEHSRAIIDAELKRLSARNPSLRPEELAIIDEALDELAESLVLSRLRQFPAGQVTALRQLFDCDPQP